MGWGSMEVEVSGPEAGAFIIISVVVFSMLLHASWLVLLALPPHPSNKPTLLL